MDPGSQGLWVLSGLSALMLLYMAGLAWRTRQIDANIRRLEKLVAEEEAAKIHPDE